MERLRDQLNPNFRTVSISGINEIHAQLDSPTQNFPRVVSIGKPSHTPSPVRRIAPKPDRLTEDRRLRKQFRSWTRRRRRKLMEHKERSSRQNGSPAGDSRSKKFSASHAVMH